MLTPSLALPTHLHWLPIIIFLITYILIAVESGRGSRLDRTAAAFCGAVAMVFAGVVSLPAAYTAISWDTIVFLLGIMILVAHFQIAHFFDWVAAHVAAIAKTPFQLLVLLIFTTGILAAFFVNDTVCLMFTPIVLAVTERLRLPKIPYLIALATSANIGSVMSVTGNPQNALVGVTAHFTFLEFLVHLAPVALIGLLLDVALLAFLFRRELWHTRTLEHQPPPIPVTVNRGLLAKCAAAYFIQFFEPGLKGSVSTQLFSISGTMLVLSNLVSNVPAVLLVRPLLASFGNSHFMWLAVASTSTLAGNATPISSVANLIVLQQAAWKTKINFWEFTRVGLVVTIATSLLAIAILALEAHFFPSM